MNEEQKEKWYNSFTKEQLIERCEYLQRSCERKENSIMELEMENANLEKGYCELKEKCNKDECDCTHEEYNNMCEQNIKMDLEIERLNNDIKVLLKENENKEKVIKAQDNIIKEFEDFITNVDSHINLGDESEEFILVRDKWLELQELKGGNK